MMGLEDTYDIIRGLNNGQKLTIGVGIKDYSVARDIFFDERKHFEELPANSKASKYSTVKITLKRNGKVLEEHTRFYDKEGV